MFFSLRNYTAIVPRKDIFLDNCFPSLVFHRRCAFKRFSINAVGLSSYRGPPCVNAGRGEATRRAAASAQGASRARWVCSPGPAQNVTSFRRLAVVSEMRGRNVLWQSFTRCHASFLPPLAADGVSRVRGGGSAPRRSGRSASRSPSPMEAVFKVLRILCHRRRMQ